MSVYYGMLQTAKIGFKRYRKKAEETGIYAVMKGKGLSPFKFSNPVPVFFLMEPCDGFFHRNI